MKNKALSIVMLACLLSLCACGVAAYEEDVRSSETGNPFPNYVYDDDAPQYYVDAGMAVSKDGYYYKKKNILHFYDIASGVNSPLCSRAECAHNGKTCDAYVVQDDSSNAPEGSTMGEMPEVNCVGGMVFYHDGHIYMIEQGDEGDYLVRYDGRFNNKERLSLIAGNGERVIGLSRQKRGGTAFLYQEYLYYMSMDLSAKLSETGYYGGILCNRVRLERGAAPEKLGAFEMAMDYLFGDSNVKVSAIGGKAYFVANGDGSHLYLNKETGEYRVVVYDIVNGEFDAPSSLNVDAYADILGNGTGMVALDRSCIDEKQNIYAKAYDGYDCGVCRISIDGGGEWIYEKKSAKDDDNVYVDVSAPIYDGEYIWFLEIYNHHQSIQEGRTELVRMRPDGSEVTRIAIKGLGDLSGTGIKNRPGNPVLYGVDKRYLLVGNDIDTYVIDRSAVGTENCVPKKISGN